MNRVRRKFELYIITKYNLSSAQMGMYRENTAIVLYKTNVLTF